MDATTVTDAGGRIVHVEGLLGRLLGLPSAPQPAGEDHGQMLVTALKTDGIDIGWTPYRYADSSGARPVWFEFTNNVGDIDAPPQVIPLGPRQRSIPPGS